MPKVFVIGIDGGSPRLIDQWRNELPHFSRFADEGVSGELLSTLPPWTCPAWLSFATGKNPGKLGVYGWDYVEPPAPPTLFDWSVFKLNPVWEHLGRAGMKTVSIGLPLTYPPKPIDGCVVSGFPAPAGKRDFTHPPELMKDITDLVGNGYGPEPGVTNPEFMRGGIRGFLRVLHSHTEKTAGITRHLLRNYPCDLFMTVFVATDRVQHNLWHLMDESHPRYKPGHQRGINPVLSTYKEIDTVLGTLLEVIDKDTNVIIMSDHGFGPFHGMFSVNTWLMQKGWLVLKPGASSADKTGSLDRLMNSETPIFRALRKLSAGLGLFELAKRIRGKQTGLVSPEFESFSRMYDLIDWSKSKAIGLEGDRIYLNRHLSPEEYSSVRDTIIAGLRDIKHPLTGGPVVDRVYTWEELYGEKAIGRPPDILFVMENYKYQQKLGISPDLWQIPYRLSGGHQLEGLVMMKGPQIKSGTKVKANIVDIAPTILHILDIPVPADMDGKVLREVFKDDSPLAQRQLAYQTVAERDRIKDKIKKMRDTGKLSR